MMEPRTYGTISCRKVTHTLSVGTIGELDMNPTGEVYL